MGEGAGFAEDVGAHVGGNVQNRPHESGGIRAVRGYPFGHEPIEIDFGGRVFDVEADKRAGAVKVADHALGKRTGIYDNAGREFDVERIGFRVVDHLHVALACC